METAGGPESRLADLHARGKAPSTPFFLVPRVRGPIPQDRSSTFLQPLIVRPRPAGFTLGLTGLRARALFPSIVSTRHHRDAPSTPVFYGGAL